MVKTSEKDFEDFIEKHLLNNGYTKRDKTQYDKSSCFIESDVIHFIKESQPKEYEKLKKAYGNEVNKNIIHRLVKSIETKGTLRVLRGNLKDRDASIRLAYFKPSSSMNPEHAELYKKNNLSIVRQLEFSKKSSQSIDMVLFLNGIPIVTIELKNALTGQYAESAIKQFRGRDPNEKLFQFKRCLVHFALGSEKVFMTTKLASKSTFFLPFNKGSENPVSKGYMTAYLWEDILYYENLLELINNYLHLQSVTKIL